jgi:3-oxoadipate enol-lactonase
MNRIATIGGVPLHYRDEGAGPPLLYLHGVGGAPPAGAAFVPMLAARHRVLIPSRPGFDETPLGGCDRVEDVARILAGFIRDVVQGKAHVAAQSVGAVAGCWLAILHPELVATLVLSAPAAFGLERARWPASGPRIFYGDDPAWTAPPGAAERRRMARNFAANRERYSAEDAAALADRLGEIAVPTLLIVAGGDQLLPKEAMRPYAAIPRLERVTIEGAAHELPIAAAEPWVRRVEDFVARRRG